MTTTDHAHSIGRRILRASLVVGIAHLLLKLTSLIQAKVMAQYVSGGTYDVVYAVSFEACIFSLFLIGEEVIGPTFLPVFMRARDDHGEEAAWRFTNVLLTLQFLLLGVVTAVISFFPELVVRLATSWTPENSPERYALAVRTTSRMAPALICLSLGSTTYMVLNGYKRFFLAAFGDASWKICVVLFVVVGMGFLHRGWEMIVLGLVVGSAAKLLTHLYGLRGELRRFRPSLDLRNPALRAVLLLMLPLVAGIVFAKVRDVFNNTRVLSTLDTEGLMQANSFGRKLYQPIGWLIPYALSIAMFPFFCELVDRNDREKLGDLLTRSGRMVLSVFIPLTLVCVSLAEPIAAFLFEGGKFSEQGVRWTAVSMACYTVVLPAAALEYLLLQAYFATRRVVAVTVIGVVFSLLSMVASYLGVVVWQAKGAVALAVIALGFSLSRTLKSAALVVYMRRSVPCYAPLPTFAFLARAVLAGLAAAGCSVLAQRGMAAAGFAGHGKLVLLIQLGVCGVAALAGFAAGALVLRLREPQEMLTWALRRMRERPKLASMFSSDSA
jgi:putative peptidoglycan lipid II flippase